MKTKTIFIAFLVIAMNVSAQMPDGSVNRAEMKKLSAWAGHWKGEGVMQNGPGGASGKSSVDERIELKLDGSIMVVEGVGKSVDSATQKETVVHHAFGIVSYDVPSKTFKFRTYLKDGRGMETLFHILSETHFEWGFDLPNGGKIKYTIKLDNGKTTWNEIGEYSGDGKSWNRFFEMNLTKQS
jgi:hypothetical protein